MLLLTQDAIPQFPHCDVQLSGIEWLPDCALRLNLLLPDNRTGWLACAWIRELRIDLDFGKNSGMEMTLDITYSQQGAKWHVLMNFAGAGSIEFGCDEVRLAYTA
jgi:hypothetical protein